MKVEELMTPEVCTTTPDASLSEPARLMWENDCGTAPVVDGDGCLIGMITDRDISMAAYTQGKPLADISVSSAMSPAAFAVRTDEAIEAAEQLMSDHQVRRLPVVDEGYRVVGILSLGDLARRARPIAGRRPDVTADDLAQTLAAVSAPRAAMHAG